MAITGTKLFASGDVLTAADTNQYLMRGVKVFASTAARDAAYGGAGEPTLEEGETCYITGTDELQTYNGSSWVKIGPATTPKILQVVSTTKTDTFTATSTGAAGGTVIDITGLTATITPSSASSTILVIAQINKGSYGNLVLKRGSTLIAQADAASNRVRATSAGFGIGGAEGAAPIAAFHLDSPATTSAVTYAASLITSQSISVAYYINRGDTDTDAANFTRSTSSITVMEVSA